MESQTTARSRATSRWSFCVGLLVMVLAPAVAAGGETKVIEGELTEDDSRLITDQSYYDEYAFPAKAGQTVRIDLMSDDLDAYLIVHSPSGEIFSDDDGGRRRNSRLTVTAYEDGQWRIIANAFSEGETGAYRLTITVFKEASVEQFRGTLEADTQRRPGGGGRYHSHTFEAAEGDRLEILMVSDDFDTFLTVLSPSGESWTDDDGGEGTNSKLLVVTDEAGTWEIWACALDDEGMGDYVVRVLKRGPMTTRTVTGTLDSDDPKLLTDGTYYEEHELELEEGQTVELTLTSDDFDAYLIVHSPDGEVLSDDDGAGGMNSRLLIFADAEGTWRVFANTYEAGETGDYELTISTSEGEQ